MRTRLIFLAVLTLILASSARAAYTGYLGVYTGEETDPNAFSCSVAVTDEAFSCANPLSPGTNIRFLPGDLGFMLNVNSGVDGMTYSGVEADVLCREEWFLEGFAGAGTVEYTFSLGFPCEQSYCFPPTVNDISDWFDWEFSGLLTISVPFDPSSLWWSVNTSVASYHLPGGRGTFPSISASAELYNVLILDENGQAPRGLSAFLENGTNLPLDSRNLAPVPEPSALILLSVGLAALARTFRRRR